jgi:hypothetical protein
MGQPEGQIQYYTREEVLSGGATSGVPFLSSLSDIAFNASDNSISSTTTDFIAEGFAIGMLILFSGSTNNNVQGIAKSVEQYKMGLFDCVLVDETAGSVISIGPAYTHRANQGNKSDAKLGERQYICTICNHAFPERLMQYFRGRWYCIPNGDFKDIASILKQEWSRGYKPAGLGTERVVPPIIKG